VSRCQTTTRPLVNVTSMSSVLLTYLLTYSPLSGSKCRVIRRSCCRVLVKYLGWYSKMTLNDVGVRWWASVRGVMYRRIPWGPMTTSWSWSSRWLRHGHPDDHVTVIPMTTSWSPRWPRHGHPMTTPWSWSPRWPRHGHGHPDDHAMVIHGHPDDHVMVIASYPQRASIIIGIHAWVALLVSSCGGRRSEFTEEDWAHCRWRIDHRQRPQAVEDAKTVHRSSGPISEGKSNQSPLKVFLALSEIATTVLANSLRYLNCFFPNFDIFLFRVHLRLKLLMPLNFICTCWFYLFLFALTSALRRRFL